MDIKSADFLTLSQDIDGKGTTHYSMANNIYSQTIGIEFFRH